MANRLAIAPAVTVPSAAPAVPSAGIRITFSTMLRIVMPTPRRSGVRASPAERSAPLNMKKSSMPKLATNMMRRYGSASACTAASAFTKVSSHGESVQPSGASTPTERASDVRNA